MEINFKKYHGAGNDFIIVDNTDHSFPKHNSTLISKMCDRRFGIGADGLMLIEKGDEFDFKMIYFNSDGFEGTMCGNGGRCIVLYAKHHDFIYNEAKFIAVDGEHEAEIFGNSIVRLKMNDVTNVEQGDNYFYLDTGSPHYIVFKEDIENFDLYKEAHAIRYGDRFKQTGTNVNFVQQINKGIKLRTYERGVEDETYACGTGAVAAAISSVIHAKANNSSSHEIKTQVKGGELNVYFEDQGDTFTDVWLEGPAAYVYSGQINTEAFQ